MLELVHEYDGDLLDEKVRKIPEKGFRSIDLLRKGHRVHRSSREVIPVNQNM
jgi:hypothetical protein